MEAASHPRSVVVPGSLRSLVDFATELALRALTAFAGGPVFSDVTVTGLVTPHAPADVTHWLICLTGLVTPHELHDVTLTWSTKRQRGDHDSLRSPHNPTDAEGRPRQGNPTQN
ncbi:hypothetical protein FB472_0038 [Rhodoglobus vestalii]|uniref:Uncharacterized protein n=1 Tax=Rhodoglobus vestalii TaxID=193384 RepID=A0A8H2K6F1_9MICO|nr:hypothetical protein [Rhodoglobus vestalii]TQO18521.1 hypothetical protein FB472_0038 [Rhodoglobus vestalii]